MKRTAKHYKQNLEKHRVAIAKLKKENSDLRRYVGILHRAVTDTEFMVFLRMREAVNGTGNVRISTVVSPDHELNEWLDDAGKWNIISVGWNEVVKGSTVRKTDAAFSVLGDKHILKFREYISFNKGGDKTGHVPASTLSAEKLEVEYQ